MDPVTALVRETSCSIIHHVVFYIIWPSSLRDRDHACGWAHGGHGGGVVEPAGRRVQRSRYRSQPLARISCPTDRHTARFSHQPILRS